MKLTKTKLSKLIREELEGMSRETSLEDILTYLRGALIGAYETDPASLRRTAEEEAAEDIAAALEGYEPVSEQQYGN